MPQIKPFKGIHPRADVAARVVLPVESLTIGQAKDIVKENPVSYANMLVPEVENPYLRGSKKELAYKKINENFDEFLEKGVLVRDEKDTIYIYETSENEYLQTGIWTVTSIDDYLNNTIRKHEHTRPERERKLIDYLQQTGIDANPVLITYRPSQEIDQFIAMAKKRPPLLRFKAFGSQHALWKIDEGKQLSELTHLFKHMDAAYIADGHHRAAAACLAGIERRKLNLKHKGSEEYNFFSSVYMSADQLKILAFNRLVKLPVELEGGELLKKLGQSFLISASNSPYQPAALHHFGMYFKNNWYRLQAKPHVLQSEDPVTGLDVSILQDFVLAPIAGILDARTDNRISFAGGSVPLSELQEKVNSGGYNIAFTLFPTSIEQLFAVADAGEIMPPKSTWFEPKFLAGLLIHQID